MSAKPTIQNVNELIRTSTVNNTYERLGNRIYKQNVLTIHNQKYQLTKKYDCRH